jgi:hypothetical protein
MKKLYFTIAMMVIGMAFYACREEKKPVSIIFDTDLATDYDDVGALTMLHALADSGEVRILATMASNRNECTGPQIDAINRYYGRADLPIGAPIEELTGVIEDLMMHEKILHTCRR